MKNIQLLFCIPALVLAGGLAASAQTINWMGHTWNVNNGSPMGSSGPGQISGKASNVTVDGSGYLHLNITGSGSTATGSELYTTDKMGFGSYYYVFQGPITSMQPSVVLSGFLYGPALGVGVDGENEFDIEFSQWNGVAGNINADFAFYPNTGYGSLGTSYGQNFLINLGGSTVNTCRIDWSSTTVTASIWTGVVSTTASTSTALKTHTYNGNSQTIPQSPIPMMFNLWTYGAYPTQALNIAVQSFQFIPQGSGGGGATLTSGVHPIASASAPGSVLTDYGNGTNNGNKVILWQSNGGGNQNWNWANVGGNSWNTAVLGPYCLDDLGGGYQQAGIWSCNGGSNQKWNAAQQSNGSYIFTNGTTGQCLDDFNSGGTNNGNPIGTWSCNGQTNQKWIVH